MTAWTDVCDLDDLTPGRGVAAVVGSYQVAIFRFPVDDELFAVSNYDPFSQAYVISRGIVGTKGEVRKVAAPIYKQNFDLRTGACLDEPNVRLLTFPVRVTEGRIEVGCP